MKQRSEVYKAHMQDNCKKHENIAESMFESTANC